MAFGWKKQTPPGGDDGLLASTASTPVFVQEDQFRKELMQAMIEINNLLQYMTGLDYVKEMIQDAAHQAETIESVAAGSEEMSAASTDISSYVQSSSKRMHDAMDSTDTSLRQIDATFTEMERNIEETQNLKEIMRQVTEETGRIHEMVNVIKAVSDQTNLLALNASIEAARAGESGRGFAVVANEIKKLADSSRQQVGSIQDIVNGLNARIGKASSEIERLVGRFVNSKTSMDGAMNGMKGIHEAIGFVGDSFNEISANVQEQTAATEEITSKIVVIQDKSVELSEKAQRTGKAFYDLSQKLDAIRLKMHECQGDCGARVMIEISIADHMMWKWRVYNMILGYVDLSPDKAGDYSGCRLGTWLKTLDVRDARVSGLRDSIRAPHEGLHAAARKAVEAYKHKDLQTAERCLTEIEGHSRKVVELLRSLQQIMA